MRRVSKVHHILTLHPGQEQVHARALKVQTDCMYVTGLAHPGCLPQGRLSDILKACSRRQFKWMNPHAVCWTMIATGSAVFGRKKGLAYKSALFCKLECSHIVPVTSHLKVGYNRDQITVDIILIRR